MFGPLAKEQHKRQFNIGHSKLIREAALDVVEDEDGDISIDDLETPVDVDAAAVPDEVTQSVDGKVDKLLSGKDLDKLSEKDIDEIADQLVSSISDDDVKAIDRNVG